METAKSKIEKAKNHIKGCIENGALSGPHVRELFNNRLRAFRRLGGNSSNNPLIALVDDPNTDIQAGVLKFIEEENTSEGDLDIIYHAIQDEGYYRTQGKSSQEVDSGETTQSESSQKVDSGEATQSESSRLEQALKAASYQLSRHSLRSLVTSRYYNLGDCSVEGYMKAMEKLETRYTSKFIKQSLKIAGILLATLIAGGSLGALFGFSLYKIIGYNSIQTLKIVLGTFTPTCVAIAGLVFGIFIERTYMKFVDLIFKNMRDNVIEAHEIFGKFVEQPLDKFQPKQDQSISERNESVNDDELSSILEEF
jgi:hypothetical protein